MDSFPVSLAEELTRVGWQMFCSCPSADFRNLRVAFGAEQCGHEVLDVAQYEVLFSGTRLAT